MDIIIMILLGWSVTFVPTTVGAAVDVTVGCWRMAASLLLEDGCIVVAVAVAVVVHDNYFVGKKTNTAISEL
jgi:hypothetical protein